LNNNTNKREALTMVDKKGNWGEYFNGGGEGKEKQGAISLLKKEGGREKGGVTYFAYFGG